jgi:hypothetical protein
MAHAQPASSRAMSRPTREEPPVTIATARRETVGDTNTRSSDAIPAAPAVAPPVRGIGPVLRPRVFGGAAPPPSR